jgi:hypothetical protein
MLQSFYKNLTQDLPGRSRLVMEWAVLKRLQGGVRI